MNQFDTDLIAALPKLRLHARTLVRDRASAEDLVQEAICNALAGKATFRPDTSFSAWISTILRNRFLSDCRRSKTRLASNIDKVPEGFMAVGASQETKLMTKELQCRLASLRQEDREALVMLAFEDMTYEELAKTTGCPIGTVKSRVFRARAQMNAWAGEDKKPVTRRRSYQKVVVREVVTSLVDEEQCA